jgi:alkanesulfonate monooxygenase SsuD/methylene tetrahydromethanopterin reductase-like flavin-dependent oxidoreductase (luciferase family)
MRRITMDGRRGGALSCHPDPIERSPIHEEGNAMPQRTPERMPAVSLAAVPGRRKATLEVAREIERRGFTGIYCPSGFGGITLCQSLALVTERIPFGTAIAPIYSRTADDYAQMAAFLHEVSDGRFRFGVGVSHGPSLARMGVTAGKPLSDMRAFVERFRAVERTGPQAPLILAAMRKKMIGLAAEIADGMVFANGARSHMKESLAVLPAEKRNDPNFFIADMIPTCISEDVEAAKAVNRRTLTSYARLPNYRNYWKEAGYEEEMADVEKGIAANDNDAISRALSDRWLADTTLFGPPSRIRDELDKWYDVGIRTPIIVPSSAAGNQMKAIEELFATFS